MCLWLKLACSTKPSSASENMSLKCRPFLPISTSSSVTSAVEQVSGFVLELDFCTFIKNIFLLIAFTFFFPGHIDDIYPYFMRHAKQIFPMLDCMDDLRKISDLRVPANW